MYIHHYNIDHIRKQLIIFLLGCMLASCAVVGPNAVRSGRLAYNEAI